jgi:ABC-type sugar transport system substrate-binding protein
MSALGIWEHTQAIDGTNFTHLASFRKAHHMILRQRRRNLLALAAVPALLVSLAACGGQANSANAGAGSSAAGNASSVAEATTLAGEMKQPLKEEIPASSAKIASNKSIVVIPCTYASEACARGADAAMEAAAFLGWNARMIDPGGDPEKSRQAVDQAVQLGADGIVFTAGVGDLIENNLQAARNAGIFTVTTMEPADKRFDVSIAPDEDLAGKMAAAAIASDSKGAAKVIVVTDPQYPSVKLRTEAFKTWLPKLCPDCEVVQTIETQFSQMQTNLPAQVQATLTAKPDVNYIWTYTGAAVAALQPTVERSANGDAIRMLSFDGNSANLNFITQGKSQAFDVIKPMEYTGYLAVHELNSLFAGETKGAKTLTMPARLVDAASMPKLPWTGDTDWKGAFDKLWTSAK